MTSAGPAISTTPISGLLLAGLPVHSDSRGWFKENWQREKMVAAGLPDFGPVQNNISFNSRAGTTRGIHAEPWDKWVSVAAGRIFGAWVDLREGPGFGTVFTAELDPSRAIFVPRGVGNAFQTLTDGTAYTYLVNDHWEPGTEYTNVNAADRALGIDWPIQLDSAEMSTQDRTHPPLARICPVPPRKILVLGSDGQLGQALRQQFGTASNVEYVTREDFDLTRPSTWSPPEAPRRWRDYETIINAAAYTAVDDAETPTGRAAAWQVNASAVADLARLAVDSNITLVHVSSDYVFDGASARPYTEQCLPNPLSVYGQTKAAGDLAATTAPRHYLVRTSWVAGHGRNFVDTMRRLAARAPGEPGATPRVVADQTGRLTFAEDLAAGIAHLLRTSAPFGTYNLTNSGPATTWAEIARDIFRLSGADPDRVEGVTTAAYAASLERPAAPRPANSLLDLAKMTEVGFVPRVADHALADYLASRQGRTDSGVSRLASTEAQH